MKKKIIKLGFLLNLLALVGANLYTAKTFAWFNKPIESQNGTVAIGSWLPINPILPPGTIIIVDASNQTLSQGTYFMYNNVLYRVLSKSGYNPAWHGLPGSGSGVEGWAMASMALDWTTAAQRYSIGAVVRIGTRFFQAMHAGNTVNPLTNYGPSGSGKPWREIQPMEDYMFEFIAGSSLRDYGKPIASFVVPK